MDYQKNQISDKKKEQIGDIQDYKKYIDELLLVWKECERVLKPNGKLVINVPLMPMLKKMILIHITIDISLILMPILNILF